MKKFNQTTLYIAKCDPQCYLTDDLRAYEFILK